MTSFESKTKDILDASGNIIKKLGTKLGEGLNRPGDAIAAVGRGLRDAGKAALNFSMDTATNLLTSPKKALHTGLGLAERALNSIPLVGGFFSFITGTAKDALTDQKFENLAKEISGLKEGLNSLANQVKDAIDGLRGEMQEKMKEMGARQDQLEQFAQAFYEEQQRINQRLEKQIDQINEKLAEHDKKIRDNAERIFKEQIKLQDVRSELKDQIRVTNTNLENLHKEQEENKQDFEKYKHQISEKSAKTEQAFDDLQNDYTRRNKIIETQIHDNEEQLSEFQENLSNVEFQQKQLSLNYQELAEDFEEQVNLAHEQKVRLDLVVNEIDDIHEEFNAKINRITQSQLEQEEKVDEAVFAAKRATRKVGELADKLEKNSQRVDNLEKQIEKNKQETQKVKEEAKKANQRIDSLLKNQQLLDNSAETQALDKIKKSLELKAEEAQLLASIELLKKTQKLITTPAEREWKVGTKQGTEKDIQREEGYLLNPNSSWAKKYTPEQLQEWGWDTRLLGDNENAPLTDPEKTKPEETQTSSSQQQQTEQSQQEQKNLQEVIEETKSQLLEQLKDIQEQINENVSFLEEEKFFEAPEDSEEEETLLEELEKKETKLRQERAQAKAKLTKSRNKQASLQQQKESTKSEIIKEQKNIKKLEQSLGNPATTPQQKKKLQENKIEKEDKITQLQKQLEKIEVEQKKQEKAVEQSEEEVKQKDKEIEQVQSQKPYSIESKKIDKEIRDAEQQANQAQHEYIEQCWQEVKATEEQVLNDSPEIPSLKQIEEKVQEIKESQSSTAAPQKSMSIAMLYMIIFLLEYIVYKRNGLTGLVVLNIILLILYWYKDQIMKHYEENYKQFGNYLLIIGYIMGNVLAYSAPEKEKYKWPSVIGFNAILAAIYGYTWYLNRGVIETKHQELAQAQQEFAEETIQKETEYIDRLQEAQETLEKVKEKTKNSSAVNFSTLSQGVGGIWFTSEEDIKKVKKIYEEIKQKWSQKETDEHLTSSSAQEYLKWVKENPIILDEEEKELIQKIEQKQKEINYQEFTQLTNKITAVSEESQKTLIKLMSSLNEEQIIAVSSQSPYLKDNQDKLVDAYSYLTKEEKLKIFNSGLDSLQINTVEKKQELLNIRLTCREEERNFDLSVEEKENILRLITNRVSEKQLKTYEEFGVPLYNASSWLITPEHKKSLLELADDLITVEDKEKLFNCGRENLAKFTLSSTQEKIVKTLAPLQREYNYSEKLLNKLHSLPSRQFLTQKKLVPHGNQIPTNPYKELKERILAKKYKEVSWQIKQKAREEVAQQTQKISNSLLPSLLYFAQLNPTNLAYQEYHLSKETFNEKEDWVSVGAIDSQHRNLLFLSGFKQVPRYYFFDLLIFAFENFNFLEKSKEIRLQKVEEIKTQILIILNEWKDDGGKKKKKAIRNAIRQLSNAELPHEEQHKVIVTLLNQYPSDNERLIFLVETWKEVRAEKEPSNLNRLLIENPRLKNEWEKYLELAKEKENRELQRKTEWLNSFATAGKSGNISTVSNVGYLEEKFERLANAYEKMREYVESAGMPPKSGETPQEEFPEPEASTSKYDELLGNLDKEEQERLKKKKNRDEARKKLQESEFNRRQANLSEKDRKLQEEEEKRQREKELAEQEAEKARLAQEARDKALEEERKIFLDKEAQRIKEAKTRAEKELAFKEEQMNREKEKREAEIKQMQKELEQREKELEQEKKLKEEELKKEMEKIAADDKEGRARMEAQIKAIELENRKRLEEEKRKNDDLLNRKKAESKAIENANAEALRAINEQIRIQEEAERKNKADGEEVARKLLQRRDQDKALIKHREECYEAVLDYVFSSEESKQGTQNPTKRYGKLRDMLNESPHMEFNLYFGDIAECNRTNDTYRKAIGVFLKAVGNRFVNKDELRRLINEKINSISSY